VIIDILGDQEASEEENLRQSIERLKAKERSI
jgi:hypothetical protein